MDTQDHAIYHVWIHLFPTCYARGEKPFVLELEMNPGPLASQATALTTSNRSAGTLFVESGANSRFCRGRKGPIYFDFEFLGKKVFEASKKFFFLFVSKLST